LTIRFFGRDAGLRMAGFGVCSVGVTPRRPAPIPSRGAASNPPNRFQRLTLEPDPDWYEPDEPAPATQFFRDATASIITYNDSPDIGFAASINPYRGCEHGCVYCYARPFHEYLGFSAGLDFETKIVVKPDAPELLRRELASPAWRPQLLALSGVTDCYQPVERKLRLTRRCLEVLAEFRNPVGIVTKNQLVTRDVDLLQELARHQAAAVWLSVTTLDAELRRVLEPRTSPPAGRLAALRTLAEAGVPVGVMVAPVIPGLTDHELPRILAAAAEAGARFAGCIPLRLPGAVAGLFEAWLQAHWPERKDKVLHRLRAMRGGKLNDPRFGSRMEGEGIFAEQIARLFAVACRKVGLATAAPELSTAAFRRVATGQLTLW
jgi:DNA repair photolyase